VPYGHERVVIGDHSRYIVRARRFLPAALAIPALIPPSAVIAAEPVALSPSAPKRHKGALRMRGTRRLLVDGSVLRRRPLSLNLVHNLHDARA